ncbi:MAG TPA: heterodisulfide reductase-related iron-sulfur binding cluster [Gemmatimonadales bacterium]|nr:heterodisulfide reductase-related iron-sulfur binding cluster [Gemmatimonadales bacterium]
MRADAEAGAPAEAFGYHALDPCVHCGFCLPACPTYLATGDESDSPRGRIVLMRALERGELEPDDDGLIAHLDACLGCRGCEPACPSGVGYGRGLEAAREQLFRARGLPLPARLGLAVFRIRALWRALFGAGRLLRATGVPARLAGRGRLGFTMAMLAATGDGRVSATNGARARRAGAETTPNATTTGPSVVLFRGCVMDGLFAHVHAATRRTLEANGYEVRDADAQVCCGALHEHAGDRAGAAALAAQNVAALSDKGDAIAVNSAGCGALLKDYGHLLGTDAAARFGAKVRDVSELLAERGPRRGAPLRLEVAYDAPCHLQHAQRVHTAPLAVLEAIPDLRLRLLPGSDRCCGSAGIYSLLHPGLARSVLDAKLRDFHAAKPALDAVTTGNPGCLMQIGAGLRTSGLGIPVVHPVELLDRSYQAAGMYE